MARTILVTGGCGFIGSAVCRHLVKAGESIINLDKLTYAATVGSTASIVPSHRYSFVQGDIGDAAAVQALLEERRPSAIINLAAESHVDRAITGSSAFIETNIVGTYTLLESARRYWSGLSGEKARGFRFLHVSTDEVYGSLGDSGFFTEKTPYDPRSPYSASKAASDHLVSAWGHTYGMPVLISNCSNNYGPYHFPEKLIPLAILNAFEGRPISVYGDGSNIRDWLYVEDHAAALHLILERGVPGQTYSIGGRNERTNLQVVQSICDLVDELRVLPGGASSHDLISFVPDRPGHDKRYGIDASKLEGLLGWKARVPFETGLRRTVRWYLEHKEWWRPLRSAYAGERLGTLSEAKLA